MYLLRPTRYVDTIPSSSARARPLPVWSALLIAIVGTLLLTVAASRLAEAAESAEGRARASAPAASVAAPAPAAPGR